ncbi:hypothetical protein GW17_00026497 [Ensete ventricosum]|nr:hypothetical protein GW17_00026497 [Ensete ventricosum]
MGLITHNRIYVCIDASPCPVIVDLVIIGSIGLSRHQAHPYDRRHARRRCPLWALPLYGLVVGRHCPCDLAAGKQPLPGWSLAAGGAFARRRPSRLWAVAPAGGCPLQAAAPTGDRPLIGRPWLQPAGPCSWPSRGWPTLQGAGHSRLPLLLLVAFAVKMLQEYVE